MYMVWYFYTQQTTTCSVYIGQLIWYLAATYVVVSGNLCCSYQITTCMFLCLLYHDFLHIFFFRSGEKEPPNCNDDNQATCNEEITLSRYNMLLFTTFFQNKSPFFPIFFHVSLIPCVLFLHSDNCGTIEVDIGSQSQMRTGQKQGTDPHATTICVFLHGFFFLFCILNSSLNVFLWQLVLYRSVTYLFCITFFSNRCAPSLQQ